MIKLTLEIKEQEEGKLELKLVDPSKKQLDGASENEKLIAQKVKNVLDEDLLKKLED